MIIPRRQGLPVPFGRPSSNLGSIFNAQINQHNLPVNIFESNPLPFRGLSKRLVGVGDAVPTMAKNKVSYRQRFLTKIAPLGIRWG